MTQLRSVLVIGSTGLIGRPVTTRLVEEGHDVRAMVRNVPKAEAVLPEGCALVRGDLHHPRSLERAMQGVEAVYLSLGSPMRMYRPEWNAQVEGVRAVIDAARAAGVKHLLQLSVLGLDDASPDEWWEVEVKREAEAAIANSGIPYTIFRPTWFTESIPASSFGPHLFRLPMKDDHKLYWLTGDDFGRQVSAAISTPERAAGQIYACQGPEALSMKEAAKVFADVWRRYLWATPVPGPVLKMMSLATPQANYLQNLLDYTAAHMTRIGRDVNGDELYRPTITVEQYAQIMLERRQLPSKLPVSGF